MTVLSRLFNKAPLPPQQDRSAAEVLKTDIEGALAPFKVGSQLTSMRTSGLLNMIQKIRETAERLAA